MARVIDRLIAWLWLPARWGAPRSGLRLLGAIVLIPWSAGIGILLLLAGLGYLVEEIYNDGY